MPYSKAGETHYHVLSKLLDKGRAIKELVGCYFILCPGCWTEKKNRKTPLLIARPGGFFLRQQPHINKINNNVNIVRHTK